MQRKISDLPSLLTIGLCGLMVVFPSIVCQAQTPTTTVSNENTAKTSPKIDPVALEMLRTVENTMFNLKTFQAECWTSEIFKSSPNGKVRKPRYAMATLVAAKPNLMRFDSWEMAVDKNPEAKENWKRNNLVPTYTYVCDGSTQWRQYGTSYRKDNNTGPEYLNTNLEPWGGFYSRVMSSFNSLNYYLTTGDLQEIRREGSSKVDNIPCEVLFYHVKTSYEGQPQEYRTRLYISRDGFIRRSTEEVDFGDKPGYIRDAIVRNIVANAPIRGRAMLFAYTPPDGVKSQEELERKQLPLLANGTVAPDFTTVDKDGNKVKLSDFKGKVVVLDFWASWCGPCVASMPHNQEVAQKFLKENLPVVFLAVDNAEDHDAFSSWVASHKEFSGLNFVFAAREKTDISNRLYHVSGIPTQFIIDANGVIRASSVGFSGPTSELEDSIRAALLPAK